MPLNMENKPNLHCHYYLVHSDIKWMVPVTLIYDSKSKLLVLDKNTWNHLIVYKLVVWRIVEALIVY